MKPSQASRDRSGFTLAEIAVTIVIVGIGLVLVLQGLNHSKMTAAHTRNMKLARELGLLTMGQVEAGIYRDDIADGLRGDYSQEGWPDFSYEVAVGDQTFDAQPDEADAEEDEEAVEPYEKVRIRVTFPKLGEAKNDLVLERWVAWEQVHGASEGEATDVDGASADGAEGQGGAGAGDDGGSVK